MPKAKKSDAKEKKPKPLVMRLTERFDKNKLAYIINNPDIFNPILNKQGAFEDDKGDPCDPYLMPKRYLDSSVNGKISTRYRQRGGKGRLFADGSVSQQGINGFIRHSIASEYYDDLDIVNCHPTMLEHLCREHKVACDALSEYVHSRESCVNGLTSENKGMSCGSAKQMYLSVMNGGSAKKGVKPSPHFTKFADTIGKLHDDLLAAMLTAEELTDVKESTVWNAKGKRVNKLICDAEHKTLMAIHQSFGSPVNCVLVFDGIQFAKGTVDKRSIERAVAKVLADVGVSIKLKVKPMDKGYDWTGVDVPVYDEKEKVKFKKIKDTLMGLIDTDSVTEKTIAQMHYMCDKDNIRITNASGDGYVYSHKEALWKMTDKDHLKVSLCDDNSRLTAAVNECLREAKTACKDASDEEEDRLRGVVSQLLFIRNKMMQSAKGVNGIFTFSKSLFFDDKFHDTVNREHDLLPIADGKVINLINGEVRDRKYEDKFSISCPVSYVDEKEWTDADREMLDKFVGQIFMGNKEYIEYKRVRMGSYLSGRCNRDIDIDLGVGRNGKSSIIAALNVILGDFFGYIGKEVIVTDSKAHKTSNKGSHTSYLMPIDGKRVIVTQELEKDDMLAADMVKKIASADPIEGVRECFGKKTRTIYPFCKLVVSSNHVPKFDVDDRAIIDRLCFNPFTARFLDEKGMEREKSTGQYDPSKYTYYDAEFSVVEAHSKPGRAVNILFSWLVSGCIDYYKVRDAGINKPYIVRDYIKETIDGVDVVGQWIAEMARVISREEFTELKGASKREWVTSSNDMYNSFSAWALQNDCHEGIGKKKFYGQLGVRFLKKRTKSGYKFEGIRLDLEEESDDEDEPVYNGADAADAAAALGL